MARIKQTRDPEVSLFQSAIDAVVMRDKVGTGAEALGKAVMSRERAGIEDSMVHQAAVFAHARETGVKIPVCPPVNVVTTEGIGQVAAYCASRAFDLAKAIFEHDTVTEKTCRDELEAKFGTCDPRYIEAAEQCAVYFGTMHGNIPYIDYKKIDDFVIDDKTVLPPNAKIAIIGDWGTGQSRAVEILDCLRSHNPDVVVHLGDVYYSGVDHETQGYFFEKWCAGLNLQFDPETRRVTSTRPRTFSLAGNHDMYSGGAPYYQMIQQLGQNASFFCLRNDDWQIIGLDTGYNDHDLTSHFTSLPPNQPAWLKDKVDNRGRRKTILLSHHQLFSSTESFQMKADTNTDLLADVQSVINNVDLWLWGHEHDLVIFNAHNGLKRGRCVGHGAYPVGFDEVPDPPTHPAMLQIPKVIPRGQSFYNNGYAIITLVGSQAHVDYYVVDDANTEAVFFKEDIL